MEGISCDLDWLLKESQPSDAAIQLIEKCRSLGLGNLWPETMYPDEPKGQAPSDSGSSVESKTFLSLVSEDRLGNFSQKWTEDMDPFFSSCKRKRRCIDVIGVRGDEHEAVEAKVDFSESIAHGSGIPTCLNTQDCFPNSNNAVDDNSSFHFSPFACASLQTPELTVMEKLTVGGSSNPPVPSKNRLSEQIRKLMELLPAAPSNALNVAPHTAVPHGAQPAVNRLKRSLHNLRYCLSKSGLIANQTEAQPVQQIMVLTTTANKNEVTSVFASDQVQADPFDLELIMSTDPELLEVENQFSLDDVIRNMDFGDLQTSNQKREKLRNLVRSWQQGPVQSHALHESEPGQGQQQHVVMNQLHVSGTNACASTIMHTQGMFCTSNNASMSTFSNSSARLQDMSASLLATAVEPCRSWSMSQSSTPIMSNLNLPRVQHNAPDGLNSSKPMEGMHAMPSQEDGRKGVEDLTTLSMLNMSGMLKPNNNRSSTSCHNSMLPIFNATRYPNVNGGPDHIPNMMLTMSRMSNSKDMWGGGSTMDYSDFPLQGMRHQSATVTFNNGQLHSPEAPKLTVTTWMVEPDTR